MPRKLRWPTKAMLLAGGLLAGLLLAEGGFRLIGVSYPLPYHPDEHCGTRLKPGFQGRWTKEGAATFSINSAGFRDREHTIEKPPNVFRVAVMGDSFVEALQAPLEESLAAVIEQNLAGCDRLQGRNVEALSFGVSGYGTAQELLALRHYALKYDPDVVVLAFFPGNDVRNNSKKLEPQQARPFYLLRDGQLVLDDSFRQHPDFLKAQTSLTRLKVGLINRSRVLQLVNELRNRPPPAKDAGPSAQAGVNDFVYAEPRDDDWRQAWRITERLIVETRQEAETAGARFVLAIVSGDIQVDPDDDARAAFAQRIGAIDLLYPNRRLAELGQQEGFTVVDLAPPLLEYARRHNTHLHGFENTELGRGHWNATGHQQAGKAIAAAICTPADVDE